MNAAPFSLYQNIDYNSSKLFTGSPPVSIFSGFSKKSFTITKNPTLSFPSTILWSYDNAKYIIGRISTLPLMAMGLS